MSPITRRSVLQQESSIDSNPSSISPSTVGSPVESPKHSPSSTSLSSLDTEECQTLSAPTLKADPHPRRRKGTETTSTAEALKTDPPKPSVMLDTYGNEFQLPDFTIKQIRDAIPDRCFERSALRGLSYVARDIACLATTFYLFNTFVTPERIPSFPLRTVLWTLYTMLQGLFGTGVWVLAHECGHQAFSPSRVLNDTVGWILHSALLVPYFSWKISHGKHHKATAHVERDMVFVPKTKESYCKGAGYYIHELNELVEETPIATAVNLLLQQLFGWPVYLFTNATGHDFHYRQPEGRGEGKRNGFGGGVNHFNSNSPLYEAKQAKLILLSDLGLLIMGSVMFFLVQKYSLANMAVWYFAPYIWVNHWLVAITYLQHTDPSLPHYKPEAWNFTRGAAATIDRDFGFVGRHLFHGIIETHVLHHFVSTIPFYNADEATEAIKPVMGRHYRSDVEGGMLGFLGSLWRSFRMCHWVEPSAGAEGEASNVLFFRNRNGLGVEPVNG